MSSSTFSNHIHIPLFQYTFLCARLLMGWETQRTALDKGSESMSSGRIPHCCKAVCLEVCVVRLVLADQEIGCLLYSPWPVRFILCHSFSKVNLPIRKKKKRLKKIQALPLLPFNSDLSFQPTRFKYNQNLLGENRPQILLKAGISIVPVTVWSCDAE